MLQEIRQAGSKPTADDRLGNVVPALAHAFGHASDGGFGIEQTEEKQADPVTLRTPLRDVP